MKNVTKLFLLPTCFLALIATAKPALALSGEDVQLAEFNKISASEVVDYNDASLIKITYVGVATQAAIGVAADALTSQAPIGTADLSFDTSNAAYDTLGELCDAIDADADYTCALSGGKRDDDASLLKNVTLAAGTDSKVAGGYAILIDTAGATATDPYIMRVGITPQVGRRVILKRCDVKNDAVGTLKVFGKLAKFEGVSDGVTRNDTTLVWSEPTADDTAESVPSALVEGGWLEFAPNEHVVVSAGNASEPQTATSYLQCYWFEK